MAIFLCHMSNFRTILSEWKGLTRFLSTSYFPVITWRECQRVMRSINEDLFVLLLAHRISGLSASYLKEKACTGCIIFFPLPRAAPRPPNTSSYRHRLKTLSHYITWPWRYLETIYGGVLSKYSHKSGGVTLLQHGYKYSIKALLACSLFTAKKFAAYFTDQPALQ